MKLNFDTYHISPINLQDPWSLCNFVVSNEERLKRYFPKTLEKNLTPDLSKIFTEKKVKQFQSKEEFLFTLKENESNNLIGLIYLKSLDWKKKHGELAYCIDYNYEGKGITTNAIQILSDHAFDKIGLITLKAIVHKSNLASIKVAENCNFTWIKTLEKEHTPPGELPLDMELYELYNEFE